MNKEDVHFSIGSQVIPKVPPVISEQSSDPAIQDSATDVEHAKSLDDLKQDKKSSVPKRKEMDQQNTDGTAPSTPTASQKNTSNGQSTKVGPRRGSIAAMNAAMAQPGQTTPVTPTGERDYFDNKWHKTYPPSGPDLAGMMSNNNDDADNGEHKKVNTDIDYDTDGSSENVNRPKLHLEIPSNKRTGGSGSVSSETDSTYLRSPAEKVRQILSETDDVESIKGDTDVMSGLCLHALFCQMDMLCHFEDGNMGWKECARWLKYEEKVDSSDRWSKPHVATTSLHALFELRSALSISTCTVILDMDASHGCMHQVSDGVSEQSDQSQASTLGDKPKSHPKTSEQFLVYVAEMVTEHVHNERGLSDSQRRAMIDVLLKPHKHKHRKAMAKKQIKQKAKENKPGTGPSSPSDMGNDSVMSHIKLIPEDKKEKKKDNKFKSVFTARQDSREISALKHQYPGSIRPEHLKDHKPNKKLMGKMPGGSEAANILIGQVDFLEEPIMVFVRLRNSAVLADMTEITVPTRFLFLVLGPPDAINIWEYEEVGRAAAALFTDRVFCEVAYKATSRQDLVDGVDEFIDDLTVLPPSIWDPALRLQPPEQSMSMDKIKKRLLDNNRHAMGMEDFHMDDAETDQSLMRTGRLFGGLWNDMKKRYSQYWSDIRDGFHPQCLASIVFLYFACITPIVTFGGLMGGATDNHMGTMETLLAGAICGFLYHLFAGQPLSIVGATGPMLIFEGILYIFCKEYEIHYLSFRFYIGMWTVLYLLLFVALDLSALVRYITRFTEESFSVLISIIFIFEAFKKLASVWKTHPIHVHAGEEEEDYKCHCDPPTDMTSLSSEGTTMASMFYTTAGNETMMDESPVFFNHIYNWSQVVYEDCITYTGRIIVDSSCISESNCTDHGWILAGPACHVTTVTKSVPDVFFFCCFLFLGTFVIAFFLNTFRASVFFPTIVRSTVSDFAVFISILTCTAADYFLELDTPKLKVPARFETTIPGRGWVVNPVAIGNWYLPLLASVPAMLATILVFLDQQITAVIVNRKDHKLKKGHGYHLDLFVLSFLIGICSLLGLPWFVAATVRAITHVRSLMRQSELRVPGERPQFLGVREQRLTGVVVHIFIGVSVLLTRVLQFIPMAVLYGVFLYMGVASLRGVQFVDRIKILLMPAKYQPDHIYLRHVETKRVHIYTIIQITCMAMMWIVKSTKQIAIGFPVLIMALCFVRKGMDFVFTRRELFWLDHLLPEDTRKAKEDKEKLKQAGIYDDEGKEEAEEDLDGEMILEGQWDKMLAKRDYGVGRKERSREKSQNVISRYKHSQNKDDESEGDENEVHKRKPLLGMSFKDRKFSM